MYIRIFETGEGYDSIELNIKPQEPNINPSSKPIFRDPEITSLARVIATLFECTDIQELGIGTERESKQKG